MEYYQATYKVEYSQDYLLNKHCSCCPKPSPQFIKRFIDAINNDDAKKQAYEALLKFYPNPDRVYSLNTLDKIIKIKII